MFEQEAESCRNENSDQGEKRKQLTANNAIGDSMVDKSADENGEERVIKYHCNKDNRHVEPRKGRNLGFFRFRFLLHL